MMTELYTTWNWDQRVERRKEVRPRQRDAHVYARARSRAAAEQMTEKNEKAVSRKGGE